MNGNPKRLGFSKSSAKGRFIALQAYLIEQEKNQINNLNLHLKQTRKRRNEEPQSQQKGMTEDEMIEWHH